VLAQVVARLDRELRELRGRPAPEPGPEVRALQDAEREAAPLVSDTER
jgi:hypothetical protein